MTRTLATALIGTFVCVSADLAAAQELPEPPTTFDTVRQILGALGDADLVDRCETDLRLVENGFPDPERSPVDGFERADQRRDLVRLLFHGARASDDPGVEAAKLMVMFAVLDGASYAAALEEALEVQQQAALLVPDCEVDLPIWPPDGAPAELSLDRPWEERDAFLAACGDELPARVLDAYQETLRQEAYDRLADAIETVYGPTLVPSAARPGGREDGPRYTAIIRYPDGSTRVQPLHDGYLSQVGAAYERRERAHQTVDGLGRAAAAINAVLKSPSMGAGAGLFAVPSTSLVGTLMTAGGTLNLANKLVTGAATATTAARLFNVYGWLAVAVTPTDTGGPGAEKAGSLVALSSKNEGRADDGSIRRSEEVIAEQQGGGAEVEIVESDTVEPDDEPAGSGDVCPVTPMSPASDPWDPVEPDFGDPGTSYHCDEMPGTNEPVVPRSCERAMDELHRQVQDGYEWAPWEPGHEELPWTRDDGVVACDDTGKNPSWCLPPEDHGAPLDPSLGWDGYHYTQEHDEALARLRGFRP